MASILVFVSMVYLALPMTIIVSKFNKAFEKFKPENERKRLQQQQQVPQEYRQIEPHDQEKIQMISTQT